LFTSECGPVEILRKKKVLYIIGYLTNTEDAEVLTAFLLPPPGGTDLKLVLVRKIKFFE
jgi:hypothetical protein